MCGSLQDTLDVNCGHRVAVHRCRRWFARAHPRIHLARCTSRRCVRCRRWGQQGARGSRRRALFLDAAVSVDGHVSCSSCHKPEGADGLPGASGTSGSKARAARRVCWTSDASAACSWDGRPTRLEDQALDPLLDDVEHGLTDEAGLPAKRTRTWDTPRPPTRDRSAARAIGASGVKPLLGDEVKAEREAELIACSLRGSATAIRRCVIRRATGVAAGPRGRLFKSSVASPLRTRCGCFY